jgi:hypothetical protein
LAEAFFRHRGLIAFAAGGAMAETVVLSFLAPAARPLAPQVTALPPLAAYHDLRWLFAFNQSWLGFAGVLVLLLLARAAVDAVLVQLAWPRAHSDSPGWTRKTAQDRQASETFVAPQVPVPSQTLGIPEIPAIPRPSFLASVLSCAVLTILVGVVMSPVVTIMFGVALVPFSWPYLAALPILLGTAIALSQGGVGQAWWRHLPPAGTAAWVIATFLILSLASMVMTHLDTPGIVVVAGLVGVIDARAWYGLTTAAVRRSAARPLPRGVRGDGSPPRGVRGDGSPRTGGSGGVAPPRPALRWVPMAPLAALMVIVLMLALTRLAFTGTVRLPTGSGDVAAGTAASDSGLAASTGPGGNGQASGSGGASATRPKRPGAILVAEGFGSSCCHDADALQAAEPGLLVRQFSYQGLTAAGKPISYDRAGDLSIQVLGDRMATQVEKLYQQAHTPVDIVAESEGTLGLYAMLARHPHVPVGSLVLLSPIIEPGQVGQAGETVPGDALITMNNLIGGMSPFGSEGAQALIDSVSEVGARYFAMVSRDTNLPWLAIVPLADAVTLPACPWPQNVIFVDAFHGGLLGNVSVRQMIEAFLSTGTVSPVSVSQHDLRTAAQLIAAAAAAWRMPQLHSSCPS